MVPGTHANQEIAKAETVLEVEDPSAANPTGSLLPGVSNKRQSSNESESEKERLKRIRRWRRRIEGLSSGAPEVLVSLLLVTLLSGFSDVTPAPVYWTAFSVIVINAAIAYAVRPGLELLGEVMLETEAAEENSHGGKLTRAQKALLQALEAQERRFTAFASAASAGLTLFRWIRLGFSLVFFIMCCWWPADSPDGAALAPSPNAAALAPLVPPRGTDGQAKASFILVSAIIALIEILVLGALYVLDIMAHGWKSLFPINRNSWLDEVLDTGRLEPLLDSLSFVWVPCIGTLSSAVIIREAVSLCASVALGIFFRLSESTSGSKGPRLESRAISAQPALLVVISADRGPSPGQELLEEAVPPDAPDSAPSCVLPEGAAPSAGQSVFTGQEADEGIMKCILRRLRMFNARYLSAVHATIFGLVIGGSLGRVLSVPVYVLFYVMLLVDVGWNAVYYNAVYYIEGTDQQTSDEQASPAHQHASPVNQQAGSADQQGDQVNQQAGPAEQEARKANRFRVPMCPWPRQESLKEAKPFNEAAAHYSSWITLMRGATMIPLAIAQLVLLSIKVPMPIDGKMVEVPMYLNPWKYNDAEQVAFCGSACYTLTQGLLFTQVGLAMALALLPIEFYLLSLPFLILYGALVILAITVGSVLGFVVGVPLFVVIVICQGVAEGCFEACNE